MKVLSERTEIAAAINFNQYPVIRIDLERCKIPAAEEVEHNA